MRVFKQDIANREAGVSANEETALRQILAASTCVALAVDIAGQPYFRYRGVGADDNAIPTVRRGLAFVGAPSAGTVKWSCGVGETVTAGDEIGALTVLDQSRPVIAGAAGRVSALLVSDGDLVGHGAALAAIVAESERTRGCL